MTIKFAGIKQGWAEVFAVLKVLRNPQNEPDKECTELENEFADFIDICHALALNSYSSAILLALEVLNLPQGSKVITSVCGSPATFDSIFHSGLVPVLVDYELKTQNIDLAQVEIAAKNGAKAVIFKHTLGNPVDMNEMMRIAHDHNLKVIEDCSEAVGSKFNGKYVGTFGDLAAFSFRPDHQLNGLGGGGMLISNNEAYIRNARSIRSWGKIPKGMKYVKSKGHTGKDNGVRYYMVMTEVQAAYLRVQLKRLPKFIKKRRHNWKYMDKELGCSMEVNELSEPNYFGFTYISDHNKQLDKYLSENGIEHRLFFSGNITSCEPDKKFKKYYPIADRLMRDCLFWGVWPGMGKKECNYISKKVPQFWKSLL